MRRGFFSALPGPALIIACAAPTWAQDPSDTAFLAGRLEKILEFEQTGVEIPWHNPKTGKQGVIVVERTYFLNPKTPCRDFIYTVEAEFSRPETFNGTGCRSATDGWRIHDGSEASVAARSPDSTDFEPPEPLIAFGLEEKVLDGPPVELRLDEEALRDFAPRASLNDSARLQRLADQEEPGGEARAPIPSGPPPEPAKEKVTVLLEPLPKPPLACAAAPAEAETVETKELDLVVVLDATASMKREFGNLQADFLSSVRLLRRMVPSLNVGFVAFRDRKDEYLTRTFQQAPMTERNLKRLQIFVERLKAAGGGDVPGGLDEALSVAEAMAWRPTALGQIVVIGDAPPPRRGWRRTLEAAHRFCDGAGEIRRSVSAVYTGARHIGASFYRRLATSGGGRFSRDQDALIENVLLSVLGEKPS